MQETKQEMRHKEIQLADLAQVLGLYLTEWLEQYQEWIIANLKQCKPSELVVWQAKLVAAEAFVAKLQSDVDRGISAKEELRYVKELEATEEAENRWG